MSVPELKTRIDDFSYQVYTDSDDCFWFRLVREPGRDVITDFFVGSFPRETSGALLVQCYKTLNFTPSAVIVFKDILSGRPVAPELIRRARELYADAGRYLLAEFGVGSAKSHVEESLGKFDLVLSGVL